jgi:hypothetical protein
VRPTRRIRILGHGPDIRVRAAADWESEPLDGLREARRVSAALDKLTRESVARAREAGHSWTQIGEALGVTKQTAWERYGRAHFSKHPPEAKAGDDDDGARR